MDQTNSARALSPQPGLHRKCTSKRKHLSSGPTSKKAKVKEATKGSCPEDKHGFRTQQSLRHQRAKSNKLSKPKQTSTSIALPSSQHNDVWATLTPTLSPERETIAEPPSSYLSADVHPNPPRSGDAATETEVSPLPSEPVPVSIISEPTSMAAMQASLLAQMKELITAAFSQNQSTTNSKSAPGPSTSSQASVPCPTSPTSSVDSDYMNADSPTSEDASILSGEEELILSEGETDPAGTPPTSGLFRPSLFKALLDKAKAITYLKEAQTSNATPTLPPNQEAAQLLFTPQTTTSEEVPAPTLFTDLVQKQWDIPAAGRPPLNSEKKFYNVASSFSSALEPPKVDEPIMALASPTALIVDSDDILKAEDK